MSGRPKTSTIPSKASSRLCGYIETLTICTEPDPLVLIMDEEGRLNDKPYNMTIGDVSLFGTLLLCGKDRDEFTDVPDWAVRGLKWHKE